eukprot:scaffold25783_cov118-Isochrysis_galbana.AAC.6
MNHVIGRNENDCSACWGAIMAGGATCFVGMLLNERVGLRTPSIGAACIVHVRYQPLHVQRDLHQSMSNCAAVTEGAHRTRAVFTRAHALRQRRYLDRQR